VGSHGPVFAVIVRYERFGQGLHVTRSRSGRPKNDRQEESEEHSLLADQIRVWKPRHITGSKTNPATTCYNELRDFEAVLLVFTAKYYLLESSRGGLVARL
jgi:phage gp16-like protein